MLGALGRPFWAAADGLLFFVVPSVPVFVVAVFVRGALACVVLRPVVVTVVLARTAGSSLVPVLFLSLFSFLFARRF